MTTIGQVLAVAGVMIEFIAFAGMAYYPIRRAWPFMTPLQLQAIGGTVFVLGVLLIFAGDWLAREG